MGKLSFGGLTSFLFGGTAPPNVTSSSNTVLPQWLQDYSQSLVARANMQGAEEYQSYDGPRIAGLNQDQKSAFDKVRSLPSSYSGVMDQSKQAYQNSTKTLPESIQSYMNPYTENVTNRARDLALRSWKEDVMPGISDIFVRNGTYGSSNMADKFIQGGRDVTEGIQKQSLADLSGAYRDSADMFGRDTDRALEASTRGGDLASLIQRMGLGDASALSGIGQQQQDQEQKNLDLAYKDFEEQRDHPWSQLGRMGSVLGNLPYGKSTNESGPLPGSEYGPSNLASLLQMISTGKGIYDQWGGGGGLQEVMGGGVPEAISNPGGGYQEVMGGGG